MPVWTALWKGLISEYIFKPNFAGTVEFEHNKAIPKSATAANQALDFIAGLLKGSPGMKIQIVGHTSNESTTYKNPENPEGFTEGNSAVV